MKGVGLITLVGLVLTGCAQPYERITLVESAMEFQYVRQVGDWNEWDEVLGCINRALREGWQELDTSRLEEQDRSRLEGYTQTPTVVPLRSETIGGGKIIVRDYRVTFVAPFLDTLNRIHGELLALRKKHIKQGDIDFRLLSRKAELGYRSNYAVIQIGIFVGGQTVPHAKVVVFQHTGPQWECEADAQGEWGFGTKIASGRNWIYGYSTDPVSKVTRYFRVNVHTQKESPIANSEEFDRLRKEDP